MGEFEDRLLGDLMRAHGTALAETERPAPRRTVPRPAWIAGGAAVVAGATIAGMSAFGGVPPAYAVTQNPDGTVTVTLREIEAVGAANAELRRLGIPVRAVPMTPDCRDTPNVDRRPIPDVGLLPRFSSTSEDDGTFTVSRTATNPGATLLIGARKDANGHLIVGFGAPVLDPVPSCMQAPNPPTGGGPTIIPPTR